MTGASAPIRSAAVWPVAGCCGAAGLLALSAAAPAYAQTLTAAEPSGPSAWRVIGALLLCLVLAAAMIYALRLRYPGAVPLPFSLSRLRSRGPRRLEVVEAVRVGAQTEVCLLRCDGRLMLIGSSPTGCVLLRADLPERPDAP